MASIISAIIVGAIVGVLGRAILPGAQDIGALKTVGLGMVSALIVGVIMSAVGGSVGIILSIILSAIVAAGILWLAIRQGILKA